MRFNKKNLYLYIVLTILILSCQDDVIQNTPIIHSEVENNFEKKSNNSTNRIDSSSSNYLASKHFGIHHQDSFYTTNRLLIDSINHYNIPAVKVNFEAMENQFALVYNHQISDVFYCYLIFDNYHGEAGSYLLITLNKEGYVIDSREFKGGDGWENGGHLLTSTFINDFVIKNTSIESVKNQSKEGEYLNSWTTKTTIKNFKLSKNGFFETNLLNEEINKLDSIRRDL